MTGLIIERPKSFSGEIKITYKCTFSNDWQQNFKDCHGIRELNIGGEVLSTDDEELQNSILNYSIILWNTTNYFQLKFTVLMKLDSYGSVCPTAFQLVQVKSTLKVYT
jgi:hypothetical protein